MTSRNLEFIFLPGREQKINILPGITVRYGKYNMRGNIRCGDSTMGSSVGRLQKPRVGPNKYKMREI